LAQEEVAVCSVSENDVTCTVATATNDLNPDQTLQVYPNPASDHISIDLPLISSPIQLKITDITGKLVYEHASQPTQSILTIPTTGMPSGYYQICIIDASGSRYLGRFLLVRFGR